MSQVWTPVVSQGREKALEMPKVWQSLLGYAIYQKAVTDMSRTWIKIYCDKWLEGSLSKESIVLRGVWITLLALVGAGKYSDAGELKVTTEVGLSDKNIAVALGVSHRKWTAAKGSLLKSGRITNDPTTNILKIMNWSKYQSEYERQKPYRRKKEEKGEAPDWIRKRLEE